MSKYEENVRKTKAVFVEVGIDENQFWKLVEMANWPDNGYDEPKMKYLETLTPKVGKQFRSAVDKLWGVLDGFIGDRNPAGGGDDSHSDFCYHIIGLGETDFYAHLENYGLMESRGERDDYEESFGYAVPYDSEWDDVEGTIADLKSCMERKHGKEDLNDSHIYFEDIMDRLGDVLGEADGEFVAEIYNKICSDEIEYVEDSIWKVKEKA